MFINIFRPQDPAGILDVSCRWEEGRVYTRDGEEWYLEDVQG
jgi:hypothetical protein